MGTVSAAPARFAPFCRGDVARACRAWGGYLWLPPAIDGPTLLWALAGCESSFGVNVTPRHEPYYHAMAEGALAKLAANPDAALTDGEKQLAHLTKLFGCDAHSSFGPWQELLCNATAAMTPADFGNLNRAAMEAVGFINRRILGAQKAQTVEQIAEAYNSGKWAWLEVPPGVERYAAECRAYYENEPLPPAAVWTKRDKGERV